MIRVFLATCAFALTSTSAAPVAAQSVRCSGVTSGHLGAGPICAAVTAALGGNSASVTVEITRDEPTALAARLTWKAGSASGRSPEVSVTSSDRPLNQRAAERLARGLVSASDLP